MKKVLAIGILLLFLFSTLIPISIGNNVEMSNNIEFLILNSGNTLYVGGNGTNNYTKIQDAIDNASNGDTVFVYNGTYLGYVIINKSINLIGENKNTTFIIGFLAYTISIIYDWVNMSGFTIQNNNSRGEGIRIDSSYNNFSDNIVEIPNDNVRLFGDNNIFSNNKITGDTIYISGDSNIISDNIITNDYYGMYLTDSCNNIISNNYFFNSGLFISDDTIWYNLLINNTVNGKPLVYLYDESDLVIDFVTGQIILLNCTNIIVKNQSIFNTTVGIQILGSSYCIISDSIIIGNNKNGIYLNGRNNNLNKNIIINNDETGISISNDNNTILDNIISSNDEGIYLNNADYNNIINNTLANNNLSTILNYGSDFNIIIKNNIKNNNNYGLHLSGHNNTIYHNNFINNTINAFDNGNNIWDNNYPSGGNYWDDYTGYDNNSDGIGDNPYFIAGGNNKDRYPLMVPWDGLNQPPNTTEIEGSNSGKPGKKYTYCINLSDPDNDRLFVLWDWGDETNPCWIGPFESGSEICDSHSWNKKGSYNISVIVKDEHGATIKAYKEITIPRNLSLFVKQRILIWLIEQISKTISLLKKLY